MNKYIKKIDYLGRIVIPKDLRDELKLNENDMVKLSYKDKEIILEKYSKIDDNVSYLKDLITIFSNITGNDYIIVNKSKVVVNTNEEIASKLKKFEDYTSFGNIFNIKSDSILYGTFGYINSIVLLFDENTRGLIIEYSDGKLESTTIKLLKMLIEKKLNN